MFIELPNYLVKEAQEYFEKTYGGGDNKNPQEYSLAIETIVKEFLDTNKMLNKSEITDEETWGEYNNECEIEITLDTIYKL